jgi:hypothetical protein
VSYPELLGEHLAVACPYTENCKLYPLFRLRASMKTWQIRYCDADFTACERYRRSQQGEDVPAELLPNGMTLPGKKA